MRPAGAFHEFHSLDHFYDGFRCYRLGQQTFAPVGSNREDVVYIWRIDCGGLNRGQEGGFIVEGTSSSANNSSLDLRRRHTPPALPQVGLELSADYIEIARKRTTQMGL